MAELLFQDVIKLSQGIQIHDSIKRFNPDTFQGIYATVKATHASRLTLNNMVYLPHKVADGIKTLVTPLNRPIGVHHLQDKDPIGRVIGVEYINSQIPRNILNQFQDSFGIISDTKRDIHDHVDVLNNLAKSGLLFDPAFEGTGYALAQGLITDLDAAQKIADKRFLTVSIDAKSDKAICSSCHHDWSEGPCEHQRGEVVDGIPMFLTTDNMFYKGYDYVNEPADEYAQGVSIVEVKDDQTTQSYKQAITDSARLTTSPIVISDSQISIDDFHKADAKPKLDLTQLPDGIKILVYDAVASKVTIMTSPDYFDGHTHIAEVTLKGTGKTRKGNSPLYDHEHKVEDWSVLIYEEEDSDYSSQHYLSTGGPMMMIESRDKIDSSATIKGEYTPDKEQPKGMTKKTEGNTTLTLEKILDQINSDSIEVTTEIRDSIYEAMSEFLVEDTKLSSEDRKNLPDSAFCGPDRSFPMNDAAHVTAARQLIDRYDKDDKATIKDCIDRKASALGCDNDDSSTQKQDKVDITDSVLTSDFVINDTVNDVVIRDAFNKIEAEMVSRQLKVDIHSVRIDELEGTIKTMKDSVDARDTRLGALRTEFGLVFNDASQSHIRAVESTANVRKLAIEGINLATQLEDNKLADVPLLEQLTDVALLDKYSKMVSELDLQEILDKVHDGTTSITDNTSVDDPTKSADHTDNTKKTLAFSGTQKRIQNKAVEIFDQRGKRSAAAYLNDLLFQDIIGVEFANQVVELLDNEATSNDETENK